MTVPHVSLTPEEIGVVPNRNMWIGNGWLHCAGCMDYRMHEAYSHPGTSDCYEVCGTCQRYYPRKKCWEPL